MKKIKIFIKNLLFALLFLGIGIFITINSKTISAGAKNGLSICFNVIIPSLFIFMVFSSFSKKTGIIDSFGKLISPFTKIVMKADEKLSGAIFLSMIGGYPVGGKVFSEMVKNKEIDLALCERILPFCINAGPSFLISSVGVLMYGSLKVGFFLYLSQVITSILMIRIFLMFNPSTKKNSKNSFKKIETSVPNAFCEAVSESVNSIIGLSGYIILFSAIIAVLKERGIKNKFFLSILEVTTGVINYQCHGEKGLDMILFLISFSGISVIFQVLSFFKEENISASKLIFMKTLHGIGTVIVGNFLNLFFRVKNSEINLCHISLPLNLYLNKILLIIFLISLIIFSFSFKKRSYNKK